MKIISHLTIHQVHTKKLTVIGLVCVSYFDDSPDLTPEWLAKLKSVVELRMSFFPLRFAVDDAQKIILCTRCDGYSFEKYTIQCGFFKAPFCSAECLMVRFILFSCTKQLSEYIPKVPVLRSLAKDVGPIEYLDLKDPARLANHFKVKSLLKPEYRNVFKESIERKTLKDSIYLMIDPLSQFTADHYGVPLEIPIHSLWCQAALYLMQFRKESADVHLSGVFANCAFLLQSGVLRSLGEQREKEAIDHISTILYLAIPDGEETPPVAVRILFFIPVSHICSSTPVHHLALVQRNPGKKRNSKKQHTLELMLSFVTS